MGESPSFTEDLLTTSSELTRQVQMLPSGTLRAELAFQIFEIGNDIAICGRAKLVGKEDGKNVPFTLFLSDGGVFEWGKRY